MSLQINVFNLCSKIWRRIIVSKSKLFLNKFISTSAGPIPVKPGSKCAE